MHFPFNKIIAQMVVFLLVSAITGLQTANAQTQDQNGQSIGKFDINKVRELSADPKATSPQTAAINAGNVKKETTNIVFTTLRIIGSLALIIALIFGVSWIIRKSGLTGTSRIGGGGSMDMMEVLPLGQHRNIVLFRVMDTVYLCSQTPSAIALLDKIEGQRAVDLLMSSKGSSTVVKFKDAFNQFVSRIKK
jgi:flagellar biogenesis protein FliO